MTIEEIAGLIVEVVRKAREHECFGVRLAERPDEELRHGFHASYHDMVESQYILIENIKKYGSEHFRAGFNRGACREMSLDEIENLLQELLRLGASTFCGCKQGCHYHDRESAIQYAEKYHELFEAIKQYKEQK